MVKVSTTSSSSSPRQWRGMLRPHPRPYAVADTTQIHVCLEYYSSQDQPKAFTTLAALAKMSAQRAAPSTALYPLRAGNVKRNHQQVRLVGLGSFLAPTSFLPALVSCPARIFLLMCELTDDLSTRVDAAKMPVYVHSLFHRFTIADAIPFLQHHY